MTTFRSAALLLGVLTLAACHKKTQEAAGEGGVGEGGGAAEAGTTDDGAADAAAGDAALEAASTDNGEAAAPLAEGGAVLPEAGPAPSTGGSGYAGTYSCFGTLKLTQTNATVSGNGESRTGSATHSTDFSCQIVGDRCTGTTSSFASVNGMQPKPKGKGKVTFRIVSGGLDYTQTVGGNTQQGFCKRN